MTALPWMARSRGIGPPAILERHVREKVDLAYRYEAVLNSRGPRRAPGSDFVMVNAETAVTDKTYEGPVGVVEWARDIFEAFDRTPRFEIEEVVAGGADFVVTMNRIAGAGAQSGAPLLFRWGAVFWVRDGKLARVVGYRRRREALRAVELGQ
jgi:ketosteroid isomerase-like protein